MSGGARADAPGRRGASSPGARPPQQAPGRGASGASAAGGAASGPAGGPTNGAANGQANGAANGTAARRGRNLGGPGLRRRRRGDPMAAYDAAPAPLRAWMAQAALPWSPASCLAIWRRARAAGEGVPAALARLDRAERAALDRAAQHARKQDAPPHRGERPRMPPAAARPASTG